MREIIILHNFCCTYWYRFGDNSWPASELPDVIDIEHVEYLFTLDCKTGKLTEFEPCRSTVVVLCIVEYPSLSFQQQQLEHCAVFFWQHFVWQIHTQHSTCTKQLRSFWRTFGVRMQKRKALTIPWPESPMPCGRNGRVIAPFSWNNPVTDTSKMRT